VVVFLHGHGSWHPQMGYTKVPQGCSVSFYTHFAKLLNQTMVAKIFDGSFAGELERTVGQFMTLPNLRMSSLTVGQKTWAENMWAGSPIAPGKGILMLPAAPPTQRRTLDELMASAVKQLGNDIQFRWLCCQSLALKQVGGRALGLNASDRTAQTGHEGHYLFKWTDENGLAHQKWVRSDSSIHH